VAEQGGKADLQSPSFREHLIEILGPNGLGRLQEFIPGPPSMSHHDFHLLSGPLISGQCCFFGFDPKEPFDMLAIRELEHELPLPDLRPDRFYLNAGLFP
jgi:hypothetical protein